MTTPSVQSVVGVPPLPEALVAELYGQSAGEKFGLSCQQFAAVLLEIRGKYLPAQASPEECNALLRSLRIEELALARACAAGNQTAWEAFMSRYRARLYEMAGAIAREDSAARELADSIYAELYGTEIRDGRRAGKLASYTGRGSLEGWLRTVLAQEFINRYRRQRRLVSLDDEDDKAGRLASTPRDPVVAVDPRVESATDAALRALSGEERFLLAAYYLDGRTLAEISRGLGVHESTISRKLDKVTKALRKQILGTLQKQGMSRRQAGEAMAVDVRDLQINLRPHLVQKTDPEAFSKKKAEPEATGGAGIAEV